MYPIIGHKFKGRYRVEAPLGRGGMAEVYKVWDEQRSVFLALKLLRDDLAQDPVFLRRFQREAKALASLQHPHIVRFYGLEKEDLQVFLVMDYIEGATLREHIARAGKNGLPLARVREVLRDVCAALNYAHSQGLLHCDIKAGNILLEKGGKAYLTDFGIARLSDAATATLVGAGTPAYMAPELVRGEEPSPQTDIYALGVVLYEMLTGGERPFTGEQATITGTTAEKVRWEQVNLPPVPPSQYNPKIPPEVEGVVLRCLHKDRRRRFSSALGLLEALTSNATPSAGAHHVANKPTLPLQAEIDSPAPGGRAASHPAASTESRPASKPVHAEAVAEQVRDARPQAGEKKFPLGWGFALLGAVMLVMFALTNRETQPFQSSTPTIKPTQPAVEGGTQVSPVDDMVQVYVPAGNFLRGSADSDSPAHYDEKPQREIHLDAFWIDQTEVSNTQYALCVEAGECDEPSSGSYTRGSYYGNPDYDEYPVIYASWYDADAYCQWAGRRLPTEAEWEKAARGADGRTYPWGNETPNANILNYGGKEGDTTRVGSYPQGASPYGALDMAGNVWEWVADRYDAGYYQSAPDENPPGPSSGNARALRGGSWYSSGVNVRAAYRSRSGPSDGYDYGGFRCAATP